MYFIIFIYLKIFLIKTINAQYFYVQQPLYFPAFQQFQQFPTYRVNPEYYRPVLAPPAIPTPEVINDVQFRGFAYQTKTDDGATSHVMFLTGPQSHFYFNRNVERAKTIASEMIDPIKKPSSRKLNTDPFNVFQLFNENPDNRFLNFYSRNDEIFSRQVPGYPANVGPLNNRKSEEISAESMISSRQLRLNSIFDDNSKEFSTTTTTTTTTTASAATTEATTTTTTTTTSTSSPEFSKLDLVETFLTSRLGIENVVSTTTTELPETTSSLVEIIANNDALETNETSSQNETTEGGLLEETTASSEIDNKTESTTLNTEKKIKQNSTTENIPTTTDQ